MTPMRWFAAIALVLALALRLSSRFASFGWAYSVAPGVHRSFSISDPLFWVLLVFGTILAAAASFLSRAHH
jgi:hypothetical protein